MSEGTDKKLDRPGSEILHYTITPNSLSPAGVDIQYQGAEVKDLEPDYRYLKEIQNRLEQFDSATIRKERKTLLKLRTEVAIEETEKVLEKLRETPKKGLEIRNVTAVLSSICWEVEIAGVHSPDEIALFVTNNEELLRQMIASERKNYNGVVTLMLRPGYQEEAQKLLASLKPGPAMGLIMLVANRLKAMGYLQEIEG